METRLAAAFPGARVTLTNDSANHRGHSGDDGSGESHFSLHIVWDGFAGQSRVARQRAVNAALGDIPGGRVHALAMKTETRAEAA
jgi:BolA family transcriptional regulator, general stress-responsive regulator